MTQQKPTDPGQYPLSLRAIILPWLAGACVGLVAGSVYLAIGVRQRSLGEMFSILVINTFLGFIVLFLASVVVGLPAAHFLRARRWNRVKRAAFVSLMMCVAGIIIALIMGIITGDLALSLYLMITVTLWCLAFAVPLAFLLEKRQRVAGAIIFAVATTAVAGGVVFALQ